MRAAGGVWLVRLRAARGADRGARLRSVRARLWADQRAHPRQVRYGIGGQMTMRLWHGIAYKPNNKPCVNEPQSERATYGRGPYDVEIVEVSQYI